MFKNWLIRWLGFSALPTPESDAKWAEFERVTRIMLRTLMDNHGHLSSKVAMLQLALEDKAKPKRKAKR